MPPEQIYVTDKRLDPDKMIFDGVMTDGAEDPHYTVSECAKFFFGRSPHWIRWLEQQHKFVLDGDLSCPHHEKTKTRIKTWLKNGTCTKCGGREVGRRKTESGMRDYTLGDIEEMAHALAQNTAITGTQLSNALLLLQTEGRVWGKI